MKQLRNQAFILLIIASCTNYLQAPIPQPRVELNRSIRDFPLNKLRPAPKKTTLPTPPKSSTSLTLGEGQNQDSFNPSAKTSPARPQLTPQRSNSLSLKSLKDFDDDDADFFDTLESPSSEEPQPVQQGSNFFNAKSSQNKGDNFVDDPDIDEIPDDDYSDAQSFSDDTLPNVANPSVSVLGSIYNTAADYVNTAAKVFSDSVLPATTYDQNSSNLGNHQQRELVNVPHDATFTEDIKRAQAKLKLNENSSPVEYPASVVQDFKQAQASINPNQNQRIALSRQPSIASLDTNDIVNTNLPTSESGESAYEIAMKTTESIMRGAKEGYKAIAEVVEHLTNTNNPDALTDKDMHNTYGKRLGNQNSTHSRPVSALAEPLNAAPTEEKSSLPKAPLVRKPSKRFSLKANSLGDDEISSENGDTETSSSKTDTTTTAQPQSRFPMISSIGDFIAHRFKGAAKNVTPQNIKAFTQSVVDSVIEAADLDEKTTNPLQGKMSNKQSTIPMQQLNEVIDESSAEAITPGGASAFGEQGIDNATFAKRVAAWTASLVNKVYKLFKAEKPDYIQIIQIPSEGPLVPQVTLKYNNQTKTIESASIRYNGNKYKVDPQNIKKDGNPSFYTIETKLYSGRIKSPSLYSKAVYNPVVDNTINAVSQTSIGKTIERYAQGTLGLVKDAFRVNPNNSKGSMIIKYFPESGSIRTETIMDAQPQKTQSGNPNKTVIDPSKIKQISTYKLGTETTAPEVFNTIELKAEGIGKVSPNITITRNPDNTINFSAAQVKFKDKTYTPSEVIDQNGITTITYEGYDYDKLPYVYRKINEGAGHAGNTILSALGTAAKQTLLPLAKATEYGTVIDNIAHSFYEQYPNLVNDAKKAINDYMSIASDVSIKKIVMQHDPAKRTITTRVTKNMSGSAAETEEHVYNY